MPSFAQTVKANAAAQFSYRPVAIFVGGTSGVGRGTAERFAHHTKGNAHIIICGRNQAAAEEIISTFPKTAESKYEFEYCDATLIKNVVQTCATLKARLPTVNYLVFSQGIMTMQGRTETVEGLDVKMALHFYSRWKFVDELLPLLEKANQQGQEARVLSVLSTVYTGKVNVDDLGLKKTYSLSAAGLQVPTYNDLFVEEYAKRYPNLSFSHIYPGFVDTPLINSNWLTMMFKPVAKVFAVSIEKCGEWMLSALLSPAYKTGGHHIDNHGDPVPSNKLNLNDEAGEKLVEHYRSAVDV